MRKIKTLIVLFLVISLAGISFASPIPELSLACSDGSQWNSNFGENDVTYVGDNVWNLNTSVQGDAFAAQFDIDYDSDPFVIANFTVQNITEETQTYTFNFDVPVEIAISGSSLYGGSAGGTITDNGFLLSQAVVSTASGTPFYAGKIDDVTVLTIYDDPTSWSTFFPGQTTTIPFEDIGLPGPSLIGPAVNSLIGIEHVFMLTAGDTIGVTSYFEVVPEPATLILLSVGSLVLKRRKRR